MGRISKRSVKGKSVKIQRQGSSCYNDRNTLELIQRKAYELYEKRGGKHGSDWSDWLEAERIVCGKKK